ncbi:hypothetical protein DMX02_30255 [Pseudomonas jessenii]|nr:hypothetical protein DMX02_30255 [Pseudomonas jessenii]
MRKRCGWIANNPRTWKTCGSELAREAGVPANTSVADIPLSRASSLPQGFADRSKIGGLAQSKVGASLLAKRQCQSTHPLLTHRFREQARSHRDSRTDRK